jgi:hypothetical protein
MWQHAEGRGPRLVLREGAGAAKLVDLAQLVDPLSIGPE